MLSSLGVQVIKQYPGQEQVDVKVVVQIPGSWFGGTASGALNASERRELFEAQAVEYAAVHEFPEYKVREPGIRFICMSDAADEPTHERASGSSSRSGISIGPPPTKNVRPMSFPSSSKSCLRLAQPRLRRARLRLRLSRGSKITLSVLRLVSTCSRMASRCRALSSGVYSRTARIDPPSKRSKRIRACFTAILRSATPSCGAIFDLSPVWPSRSLRKAISRSNTCQHAQLNVHCVFTRQPPPEAFNVEVRCVEIAFNAQCTKVHGVLYCIQC